MEKPLVRYTIGGHIEKPGKEIFFYSLKRMKKIIGDRADIVLCWNNIDPSILNDDGIVNIEKVDQQKFINSLSYQPKGVAWKLYPPRLRPNSHEIFIDNDFVIEKLPEEIEIFLARKDHFFCVEGLYTNTHGRFSDWPEGSTFNSGLFGIPPNFDFRAEISKKTQDKIGWTDRFDEQGLVGEILFRQNLIKISREKIEIYAQGKSEIKKDLCGYHFAQSNYKENTFWNQYKAQKIKMF